MHNPDFFSSRLIVPTIIVIVVWEWTGYNMTILYTALRAIPTNLTEAAILDGARCPHDRPADQAADGAAGAGAC